MVSIVLSMRNLLRCHVKSSPQPPRALAQKLLAYWAKHPEAFGTVESIVEWWVLEQQIGEAVHDVEATLNELVKRGLVIRCRNPDGRTLYRLNQEGSQSN